ncbi:MAG: preprotein translocase subunit SecE [Clostridiales bacterium]|nr:preprotein translocase subunit SecE [Clostridiales bacterium]
MPDYEKNEQAAAAKADKPKKDAKKSKPGFFARIGKWFREMKVELKKVQWPTKKQTINNTVVVIVCCIVVGICIWAFDWLAQSVFAALMNLFKG